MRSPVWIRLRPVLKRFFHISRFFAGTQYPASLPELPPGTSFGWHSRPRLCTAPVWHSRPRLCKASISLPPAPSELSSRAERSVSRGTCFSQPPTKLFHLYCRARVGELLLDGLG